MTRIFTDGAEFGDALFWDASDSGASTTHKRSGGYAYGGSGSYATKNITSLSEFYLRIAWYCTSVQAYEIVSWKNGSTVLGIIKTNTTTKRIEIYTGNSESLKATGSIALHNSTWYLIELHVKINASGEINVRIDGIDDAAWSGDTTHESKTSVDNLHYDIRNITWIDDLALNDTAGGADNSWCGDGKVFLLFPNGDGTVNLTPSRSGTHYDLVNEIPSDEDTTYVEGSTANTDYDLYDVGDTGLTGITITRAWVEGRAKDTVADGGKCALMLKSGATEQDSSDISLITSYTRIVGTDHAVDPNTSEAWTTSGINAAQIGFKVK